MFERIAPVRTLDAPECEPVASVRFGADSAFPYGGSAVGQGRRERQSVAAMCEQAGSQEAVCDVVPCFATVDAMAAGWQQQDVARCVIQARHRSLGLSDDEEIPWLFIPSEWRHQSTRPAEPHTPSEVEQSVDGESAVSVITCCSAKDCLEPTGEAVTDCGQWPAVGV